MGSECQQAPGYRTADGYAKAYLDGRQRPAHVVAFIRTYGPVPDGYIVGHRCHDEAVALGLCAGGSSCLHRGCCNPEHLEAQTRAENARASAVTKASLNAAKTHCDNGHEFTVENTYVRRDGSGGRRCRVCGRETTRKYKAKTRA